MNTLNKTAMVWISSLCAAIAQAQPAIYKDADYKLGEKLIAESKCVACHVSKVGGNGSAIYKPQGRINNASLLRWCSTMYDPNRISGVPPEEMKSS